MWYEQRQLCPNIVEHFSGFEQMWMVNSYIISLKFTDDFIWVFLGFLPLFL